MHAVQHRARTNGRHVGARCTTGSRSVRCNAAKEHAAKARTRSIRRVSALRETSVRAAERESEAATIAKVLATPCQNTLLTPEPANLTIVKAAVLCLINTARAENGKEPLRANAELERAAESHGLEMLSVDYFDHVAPSGETPLQRIEAAGYVPGSEAGYVIGENLAWGTYSLATPQAIVSAWIASPEHLANILEGKYRDTGIDVRPEEPAELAGGAPGALYTQEFGVIVR